MIVSLFSHRVADYGFSKLIELFEAVPGTVEVTEDIDGERLLQLSDGERLVVLGEQISSLIKPTKSQTLKMEDIPELYRQQFGYQLRPDNYLQRNLATLLKSPAMEKLFRVEGDEIRLIDRSYLKVVSEQVRDVLVDQEEGQMSLDKFKAAFEAKYGQSKLEVDRIKIDLSDVVEVTVENGGHMIKLVPLQLCAIRIGKLIKDFKGELFCSELEAAFAEKYKTPLCPGKFGYHGINSLIQQGLSKYFTIRGKGNRKMICPVSDKYDDGLTQPLNVGVYNSSDFALRAYAANHHHYHHQSDYSSEYLRRSLSNSRSSSSSSLAGSNYGGYNVNNNNAPYYTNKYAASVRFSNHRQEGIRIPSAYHRHYNHHHGSGHGHHHYPRGGPSSYRAAVYTNHKTYNPNFPCNNSNHNNNNNNSAYYNDLAMFGLHPRQMHEAAGASNLSVSPSVGSPIAAPSAENLWKSSEANNYRGGRSGGGGGASHFIF